MCFVLIDCSSTASNSISISLLLRNEVGPSMSELCYLYTKKRREFGLETDLQDSHPSLLASIEQVTYQPFTLYDLHQQQQQKQQPQQSKPQSPSILTYTNASSSETTTVTLDSIQSDADASLVIPITAGQVNTPIQRPKLPKPAFTPRMVSFYTGGGGSGSSTTTSQQDAIASSVRRTAAATSTSVAPLPKSPFVESFLTTVELDCIRLYAEASVNTETIEYDSKGSSCIDGCWPKEVDPRSMESIVRYKRKIEKSPQFAEFVLKATNQTRQVLELNNSINIYEEYFLTQQPEDNYLPSPPFAKIVSVIKDPAQQSPVHRTSARTTSTETQRSVTCISWHPDKSKFAVSFCSLASEVASPATSSYIWNLDHLQAPAFELKPPSPLICISFHPHQPDLLIGGCHNGTICLFDTRVNSTPISCSSNGSHTQSIRSIVWLPNSVDGTECVSGSLDGTIRIWNTTRLDAGPIEVITLSSPSHSITAALPSSSTFGATCIATSTSHFGSNRFLVGTDQCALQQVSRKTTRTNDTPAAITTTPLSDSSTNGLSAIDGHHGLIQEIHRHPIHTNYFLTIGDWMGRMYLDDLAEPIFSTQPHTSFLTNGCWSPTKPNIFFTISEDGILAVYDLLGHQPHTPCFSLQLSNCVLTSIAVEPILGTSLLVGDENGHVFVVQLSSNLCESESTTSVLAFLDRQARSKQCQHHLTSQFQQPLPTSTSTTSTTPSLSTKRKIYDFKPTSSVSTLLNDVRLDYLKAIQV